MKKQIKAWLIVDRLGNPTFHRLSLAIFEESDSDVAERLKTDDERVVPVTITIEEEKE